MTDEQYVRLSVELLFGGTDFQRNNIRYLMENYTMGKVYLNKLKHFIDIEMELGKIDDSFITEV